MSSGRKQHAKQKHNGGVETFNPSQLVNYAKTGRTLPTRMRILLICLLRFLRDNSPPRMKRYFDLPVKGMLLETDVKFFINTLHDFFVFSSLWEEELKDVFRFKEGMNFLDVGAHIGKYAVRAAIQVGRQGKVVALEPDRDNFIYLVRNLKANGLTNCLALNVAAYHTDTEISLFTGPNSAQHSIKKDFGEGSFKTRARALDNVLKEKGIEGIDFIKLDVEDAEFEVLKGLENTLKTQTPTLVIELQKENVDEVVHYLGPLGYVGKLVHIYLPYKGGLVYYYFSKNKKPNNLETRRTTVTSKAL